MSKPFLSALVLSFAGAVGARAQITITEFPVPTAASRPYTIVAGPDGNLWFTESVGNKLGRITPSGSITEFPVPTAGSGPYGIAVGPDGNIWFTERFADQIGRFVPATGNFTEYPIPSPFCQPWEITLGADGNLWFTEEEANQIGRITPQGAITEFIPPNCCFPTGICAGADGRIWFTLEIGDQIGRVDPSGAMTMFQIQTVQVLPWDIAPGPDGALWFTELAGRAVGRITTAGQIVEHPVPGSFSGIAGVASGSDGNLWFTENDTHHVGVMDTAGNVLQTLDTTGERPLSITPGPDGNLWFTMADGNAIGRVEIAQPGEQHVLSLDAGFVPRVRTVTLGDSVQWTFLGPRVHWVDDASGLDLFDSGPRRIVSYYEHPFDYAGTFAYQDNVGGASGAITVPVEIAGPAQVGVPFTVTWALAPAPAGIVFDVQVRTPGSSVFVDWMSGTTLQSADYVAVAPGNHRFRARLRELASGETTRYARPTPIIVQ